MEYKLIIGVFLTLIFLTRYCPTKVEVPIFIFFVLILNVVLVNRPEQLGSDFQNYFEIFELIRETEGILELFIIPYEPGFVFSTKFLSYFLSAKLYFFLGYCTILLPLLLKRSFANINFARNLSISIIMLMSLNGYRQFLALTILAMAYLLAEKKYYFKAAIITILSMSFHLSATYGAILIILRILKWNRLLIPITLFSIIYFIKLPISIGFSISGLYLIAYFMVVTFSRKRFRGTMNYFVFLFTVISKNNLILRLGYFNFLDIIYSNSRENKKVNDIFSLFLLVQTIVVLLIAKL